MFYRKRKRIKKNREGKETLEKKRIVNNTIIGALIGSIKGYLFNKKPSVNLA